MAEKLDTGSFDSFVENSALPVLVDFYNDGCVPCRRISPILSKAEEEYGEKLKFAKVNIAMNPDLIERFSIAAAPTLIVFKDGRETNRHRGAAGAEDIKNLIKSIL